jgi:hypothetical protein
MIKKIEFIEDIQFRLTSQMSTKQMSRFHERIIEHNIGLAYSTVLLDLYAKGFYNLDDFSKRFTSVAVTLDTTQNKYFSTLPDNIISFPRTGSGIVKIIPIQGEQLQLVPRKSQDIELIRNLELSQIDNTIKYTLRGNSVEYVNMSEDIASVGVNMDLVIPFSSYDYDDDVPIPHGQNERMKGMVLSMLLNNPVDDQLNNNSNLSNNKTIG